MFLSAGAVIGKLTLFLLVPVDEVDLASYSDPPLDPFRELEAVLQAEPPHGDAARLRVGGILSAPR